MIGDDIEIVVVGIDGDNVRIGIVAPKQVDIYRKEIYRSIQETNQEASQSSLDPARLGALLRSPREK